MYRKRKTMKRGFISRRRVKAQKRKNKRYNSFKVARGGIRL
jgi:hypothetical protein